VFSEARRGYIVFREAPRGYVIRRKSHLRWLCDLASDEAGNALLEFSVVAPLFLTLWLGLIELGFIFNNYTTLTDATDAGARQLAIERTISSTPYSDVKTQIQNYSGMLGAAESTTANITTTMTICTSSGCSACSADSTCLALLTNAQGYEATVNTSYPCFAPFFTLTGCSLSARASNIVQ